MRSMLKALSLTVAVGTALLMSGGPSHSQTSPELTKKVLQMERDREQEFENYFGEDLASVSKTADETAAELERLSAETGTRSALLYVIPRKSHLHLVLIPPSGTPIVKDFYEVTDPELFAVSRRFHKGILRMDTTQSQSAGQQLYDWIIKPYEQELADAEIDLLLFCLGDGVKDLALPALFNNGSYLIESYAMARIPAFNLIETTYKPFKSGQLLAMGASQFQDPSIPTLPGTAQEIAALSQSLGSAGQSTWGVTRLENRAFTQKRINQNLSKKPYTTLHVSTHAQFQPGQVEESYIQLWDQKLKLNALNAIDWDQSKADLIVLSACQTALGDTDAANGFAGLALKAGVPSAIGTLWSVNDQSTTELMTSFYGALPDSRTKAQALQTAQITAIRQPSSSTSSAAPYYWAGFSLISTPW
ncbi:CHAT domain-containing protein [Prochlorococcus sp. MIT 1306]|nr:CHAT domain-containing protein [Prochlorococcus sp. MIT 1306]